MGKAATIDGMRYELGGKRRTQAVSKPSKHVSRSWAVKDTFKQLDKHSGRLSTFNVVVYSLRVVWQRHAHIILALTFGLVLGVVL